MDAPNTSAYILATADVTNLPESRTLQAAGGLIASDTGPENSVTITTVGNLKNLNELETAGFVTYNTSAQEFIPVTFQAGTGIAITNPDGQVGDTSFSVVADTTRQRVLVQTNNTVDVGDRSIINFIQGPGISVSGSDSAPDGRVNITIGATGSAASELASFITKTVEASLPNSQALGALTVPPGDAGIMKVAEGSGDVSIAVAGTDYQKGSSKLTAISGLTAATGSLIVGTGGSYSEIDPGPTGYVYTSTGASSGWAPPQSGHPFPVVQLNTPIAVVPMVPNTFYSFINPGPAVSSGRLPSSGFPPLPNYGDQFLMGVGPTLGSVALQYDNVNLKYLASTRVGPSSISFPLNQASFIWLMYIGIIAGVPTYQVLSYSSTTPF